MNGHLLADALQRTGSFEAVLATTPRKALQLLQHALFDVVLIAIEGQEHSAIGSSFVREVRRLHPGVKIIVLLETRSRKPVLEALACGACGVFCLADGFETLRNCIRCVHAGQVWACSAELQFVVDALFEQACRAPAISAMRPLSKRELQTAKLVAEGCSNRQIATRLSLSEHTVKNYLFRIFEKIGVSTRVGLTLFMLKESSVNRTVNSALREIPVAKPADTRHF
jgi:two-component system, NarL family, nitrate/nitrite response regulator NarL